MSDPFDATLRAEQMLRDSMDVAKLRARVAALKAENAALRAISDAAREVEREWHRQEEYYRPYFELAMGGLSGALEDFDAAPDGEDGPQTRQNAPGAAEAPHPPAAAPDA